MMVGDPLPTTGAEQQEQRAQCIRFCMTVFFLFATFFLIRVQQDTYTHHYERRRRKTDPLFSPEAASLDVVYVHRDVSRGLWVRGSAGSGSVLTSAFLAFVPGDVTSSSTAVGQHLPRPVDEDGSEGGYVGPAEFFSTYEPLAYLLQAVPSSGSWALESNSPWGPKINPTAHIEVGALGFPSILAVYRDTRLFRHGGLPGCDAAAVNHCLLSLVRLPLSACTATQRDVGGVLPVSWTCSGVLDELSNGQAAEVSAAAGNLSKAACIRLVSGPSLVAISGYATEALTKPLLESTPKAGVILQFCGAPLPQLIAVDAIAGRIFFAQRFNQGPSARRLSAGVSSDPPGRLTGEPAGRAYFVFPQRVDGSKVKQMVGVAGGSSGETYTEATDLERRLNGVKKNQGLATICVAYAYLDGFYDDVSRCLPVETEAEGSDALGDPVYMQVDPLTDAVMFAAFDSAKQMVLSLHHALSMKRKFAVRFEGFQSGDGDSYKHRLDIIDVATGYHERIDISPAS